MNKLLLILLFSFATQAQTTMKEVDIDAAAGNRYETLLTNREAMYGDANIQDYLQHNGFIDDEVYNNKNHKTLNIPNVSNLSRYKKQTLIGFEKQSFIWVKLYFKKVPEYSLPMVSKVEIYGDKLAIIQFYCNFWSRSLNFNDVKPGEIVATRFLTDVATLSYPDATTAKITVVTTKNR